MSWSTDIFPLMQGTWGCTSTTCHGGASDTPFMTGSASAVYASLAEYTTLDSLPFVNPCSTDPAESTFVCALTPGGCGILMPEAPGTMTDGGVEEISTWVSCGAPQN